LCSKKKIKKKYEKNKGNSPLYLKMITPLKNSQRATKQLNKKPKTLTFSLATAANGKMEISCKIF